jgi:hypothetical protein
MSEQPEPEPTLRDVLAAIEAARAESAHRFDRIDAAIGQLRADVASVKVDTAYVEAHIDDQQTAIRRHLADPDAHRRAA